MSLKHFMIAALWICVSSSYAQELLLTVPPQNILDPERRIEDVYADSPWEEMVAVAAAQVILADYELIKHDFPFLRDKTHREIDTWLLDSGGRYISKAQAAQAVVNTPIVLTGETRKAYRPPSYGRAVIYDVSHGGFHALIDSNGDGVRPGVVPSHNSHGNGLGTLAEKLRDFRFENAFRASLIHAKSQYGSIGSYAVISLGFDVRYPDGGTMPAGKYMRQAHHRLNYDDHNVRSAWLPGELKKGVLEHISRYGFYTGWETNLQGVIKDGRIFIFDFGHWIAWQGYVPEAGIWVDPHRAVDFSQWGWSQEDGPRRDQDQWRTSQLDRPFQWARDTAFAVRHGKGREAAVAHYNNMLGPFLKKLGVGAKPPCKVELAELVKPRLLP